MKIALIVALIIVGIIAGGVLYIRQKIAEKFGDATFRGDVGDLSRRVALPMMDDQWLGERRRQEVPPESATRAKGGAV